jgi:hypothetical protein
LFVFFILTELSFLGSVFGELIFWLAISDGAIG